MAAPRDDDAAEAMARVLRAERDAAAAIVAAQADARRHVDAARDAARARVERGAAHIAARQQRHAQALAARIVRLQAQAALPTRAPPPDDAAIDAAVARVAAQLTGGWAT